MRTTNQNHEPPLRQNTQHAYTPHIWLEQEHHVALTQPPPDCVQQRFENANEYKKRECDKQNCAEIIEKMHPGRHAAGHDLTWPLTLYMRQVSGFADYPPPPNGMVPILGGRRGGKIVEIP